MFVKHLDHLNLSVKSFVETADWYHRVFGFEIVERGIYSGKTWGILKSGDAMLCVYENPEREFWDRHHLTRINVHHVNHFALRITDRTRWEETIKRERVEVENEKEWRWPHSTSWYIFDNTGYYIEVVLWDNDTVKFS